MWQIEWYDANGDLLDDDEAYATLFGRKTGVLLKSFHCIVRASASPRLRYYNFYIYSMNCYSCFCLSS